MICSILLCTIDRLELTIKCVGNALATAGYPFELLSVDNGSTDIRVIDYVKSLTPRYHKLNKTNLGYAPMLNTMLWHARGTYFCVIDNDIMLPNNWLKKLVEVNRAIPESGISGYHCVQTLHPVEVRNGMEIHPGEAVHGIKFFSRSVLKNVGYFCEDFCPYGNEDVDYNRRCRLAGFTNYYLGGGDRAQHLGEDCSEKTPYRMMKWESLKHAADVLGQRFAYYDSGGSYYIGPPERLILG